MAETTTITVRIPIELRDKLDRLAKAMERSRSYVAVEALEIYARYEIEILDGIEEGIADFEAGRFKTHEQVVEEMDQYFAELSKNSQPKPKKVAAR